jgi:hypothetical protein
MAFAKRNTNPTKLNGFLVAVQDRSINAILQQLDLENR